MLTLNICAHAKSASDIFQTASPSIVIVLALDTSGKERSLGSGVIISKNLVITNCHVISNASRIYVKVRGKVHQAKLRHSDPDRDVCSVTVNELNGNPITFGKTSHIKVGERVYTIGTPKGLELTLSEGIISSLRKVQGGQYIQITAPISPGSSGGGLFDENGKLIGLPTFYLKDGQQLNFALPVEWIEELPARHGKRTLNAIASEINWNNEAIVLEENGGYAELVELGIKWTNSQPLNPVAWGSLGFAYVKTGHLNKGIIALKKSLNIFPLSSTWYVLGLAYEEEGQPTKALEAFKSAVNLESEHGASWQKIGDYYALAGHKNEAIDALQRAVHINSSDATAWYNLGSTLGEFGEHEKAIDALLNAIRINDSYAKAWANLGIDYFETSQYSNAIEASQNAIRLNPDDAESWNNIGISYINLKKYENAVEALQQAIYINPNDDKKLFNLGYAYSLMGNKKMVMKTHNKINNLNPETAEIFFNNYVKQKPEEK